MKITYYGTAAAEGWPGLFCLCEGCMNARKLKGKNYRTRSQALINDDLLIDFPPDTYLHVLMYGLDLNKIENIIITHAHEDHLYMKDLANRQDGYCFERKQFMLNIYGNSTVAEHYERVSKIPWNETFKKVLTMNRVTSFSPVKIKGYTVYPMKANHNPLEEALIYVVRDKEGKTLLYAHDTGILPKETFDYIEKNKFVFDYVSLDCTSGKIDCEVGHMGMKAAAKVKEKLISMGAATEKTIFTVNHFSHNGKYLSHEDIEKDAGQYGFLVSYDGMQVEF